MRQPTDLNILAIGPVAQKKIILISSFIYATTLLYPEMYVVISNIYLPMLY